MTITTVSVATGCGGLQRSRRRGSGSIAAQIKGVRLFWSDSGAGPPACDAAV